MRGWAVSWVRLDPRLTKVAIAYVQLGVLLAGLIRGLDYAVPPKPRNTQTLTAVEGVGPIEMWGWIFIVVAGLGLVGLRYPRLPLTALGHTGLFTLYSVFGVGALISSGEVFPPNDFRTGAAWLIAASTIHCVFSNSCWDVWRTDYWGPCKANGRGSA